MSSAVLTSAKSNTITTQPIATSSNTMSTTTQLNALPTTTQSRAAQLRDLVQSAATISSSSIYPSSTESTTAAVKHRYRKYNNALWRTYIREALQSGNHREYCRVHNIPYSTFKDKHKLYRESINPDTWQPTNEARKYNHRIFCDECEKQAAEQWHVYTYTYIYCCI